MGREKKDGRGTFKQIKKKGSSRFEPAEALLKCAENLPFLILAYFLVPLPVCITCTCK
jgi:hypothetical protein